MLPEGPGPQPGGGVAIPRRTYQDQLETKVAQRTREFGVRMALGADSSQVTRLVLQEGVLLASAGLALGLGGTYLVGRAMKSVLYGVSAIDPAAVGAVAAMLLLSAVLACYVPARRATHVDPMIALRYE